MIDLVKDKLNDIDQQLSKLKSLIVYMDDAQAIIQENQSLTESFNLLKNKSVELFDSAENLFIELTSSEFKNLPQHLQNIDISLSKNQAAVSDLFKDLKETLFSETTQISNGYSEIKIILNELVLNQKTIFNLFKDLKDTLNNEIERRTEQHSQVKILIEDFSQKSEREISFLRSLISDKSEEILKGYSELTHKLDSFEFTKRFAKFDDSLFSIQQSIINNQSRIESIERNIKDDITYKVGNLKTDISSELKETELYLTKNIEEIKRAISNSQDNLEKLLVTNKVENERGLRKIKLVLWSIIVLQTIGFIWLYFKK